MDKSASIYSDQARSAKLVKTGSFFFFFFFSAVVTQMNQRNFWVPTHQISTAAMGRIRSLIASTGSKLNWE